MNFFVPYGFVEIILYFCSGFEKHEKFNFASPSFFFLPSSELKMY